MKDTLKVQLRNYIKTYWGQKAHTVGYKEDRHRRKTLKRGENDYVGDDNEDEGSDVDKPLARRQKTVSKKRKAVSTAPPVVSPSTSEEPPAPEPPVRRQEKRSSAVVRRPQICTFCDRQIDPSEYSDEVRTHFPSLNSRAAANTPPPPPPNAHTHSPPARFHADISPAPDRAEAIALRPPGHVCIYVMFFHTAAFWYRLQEQPPPLQCFKCKDTVSCLYPVQCCCLI